MFINADMETLAKWNKNPVLEYGIKDFNLQQATFWNREDINLRVIGNSHYLLLN